MAEELEIKVRADTGEAVTNLKKTEDSVAGLTKETEKLNNAGKKVKDGFFEGLSKDLNGITGGFTKFLEATGKLSLIFGAAAGAGKALAAGIDAISESLDKTARREGEAIDRKIKFDKAIRLAREGTIALGHSTEEMLKNYDTYVTKMSSAAKATEAQTKALERQKLALDSFGDAIKTASEKAAFKLLSPEEAFGETGKYAEKLSDILKKAFDTGDETDRKAWVKANQQAIDDIIATYKEWGDAVPESAKKAYEALIRYSTDWAEVLKKEAGAAEEAYQQKLAIWAAEDAAGNRTSRAPEAFKQIQDAAVGADVALGKYGDNLDRIADLVVKTGGSMAVGAPIFISYAMATDQATDALLRHIEALKGLRAEQVEALSATKGWTDYVIALKEGYDSGVTSLGSYIQQLIAFKAQLEQMYAGATGGAREALEAMESLIEKLMSTAGGRDAGSGNRLLDELNRAVAAEKARKGGG